MTPEPSDAAATSTNRLIESTSPYLLQHAHNPVNWWPWSEEALELARTEGKPILLSIGYSACHWCHVMAHESFEDAETAALMNELFVNIKVDREERPDLDKIYQSAHQLLSQRPGGWPLTVFLTPEDQMPFFAGTYFPDQPRHGMISFRDLMQRVHAAWHEQKDAVRAQNNSLAEALGRLNPPAAGVVGELTDRPLDQAREELSSSFEPVHGGFGGAPKFPHCTSIERLLRHWAANPGDSDALDMALHTLERMASGGIYDHLGGGFCRYSTDERWLIPHFEKMLYDNGPLLGLYADAWRASANPLFKQVCEETAAWVMREMQSEEGGYFSTLDADSEGEEGKFYVWTPDEVRSLLNAEEYETFARRYGLNGAANFEGKWNLYAATKMEKLGGEGLDPAEVRVRLESASKKLFDARQSRIRPGRDEKVLTSWNALMIKGMAQAGRALHRREWIGSAENALAFVRSTLWRDGRLLATCKDGKAHLSAYLDDYANLIDALLELLQCRWRNEDLEFAVELAEVLLTSFEDEAAGGFFFTGRDHERLIHNPKPFGDDSVPAGNGIAARVLLRLGWLLAEPRYLEAAEKTLHLGWSQVSRMPSAHCALLNALEEYLEPTEILVVRADGDRLARWTVDLGAEYLPRRMVLPIPGDAALPAALAEKTSRPDGLIYRCLGTRCDTPVAAPALLDEAG